MTDPTCKGWRRCPSGAFRRLTADLAARRARHLWLTVLGVVAGTVLTGVACWQAAAAIGDWQHGRWNALSGTGGCGSTPSSWTTTPSSACQPAPYPPADAPKK
jgi:hypothetical protein